MRLSKLAALAVILAGVSFAMPMEDSVELQARRPPCLRGYNPNRMRREFDYLDVRGFFEDDDVYERAPELIF